MIFCVLGKEHSNLQILIREDYIFRLALVIVATDYIDRYKYKCVTNPPFSFCLLYRTLSPSLSFPIPPLTSLGVHRQPLRPEPYHRPYGMQGSP